MDVSLNIVSVDDTPMNLLVLESMANQIDISINSFESPRLCLDYFKQSTVDIAFVDYMMPDMDGLTFIREAKAIQPEAIFVMVTAATDEPDLKVTALTIGATDFLTKPVQIAEFQAKLRNLSYIKTLQKRQEEFNSELKKQIDIATKELVKREHEALKVLSKTAEYRDPETGSHIARVAHYSKIIAHGLGLSQEEQDLLFYASPLHDAGKVGIADTILLKPGKLTDEEFCIMKDHARIGFDILKDSTNPYLKAGAIIAHEHHEKYDGTGYPRGLVGEEIHIFGRITAIADVFDALTSYRPYKKPWSIEESFEFLQTNAGKHFDPTLVNLFVLNRESVCEVYRTFDESGEQKDAY